MSSLKNNKLKAIEVDCRFFDALSDAIIIFDENYSLLYVSSGAEKIFEKPKNEIILKNCKEIFGENFSENISPETIISAKITQKKKIKIKINYLSKFDEFTIAIISKVSSLSDEDLFMGMVGASYKMKEIFELIKIVAPTNSPVMITGETGTGKEMVAEAIHNLSKVSGPLIKVNCSALPESLLEAELFGYVKGAFTGAEKTKPGKFELAHNGTLFLDEIGDLPLALQPKILRAVERGEIEKLGDTKVTKVNCRIICATNRNIEEEVVKGNFRSDLYFRLSVFRIHIPPLRERKEDIIHLADYILERLNKKYGIGMKYLTKQAIEELLDWHFPGNIRELENLLERAYVMSKGNAIDESIIKKHKEALTSYPEQRNNHIETLSYQDIEREKIWNTLLKTGSISSTAKELNISRVTLWRKMKKYGIAWRKNSNL